MRDFFLSLLQSVLRDLLLVGVATLVLGSAGWVFFGFPAAQAFGVALLLCVALWLFLRFSFSSGEG